LKRAHIQRLIQANPAFIEVFKMGERPVQESSHLSAARKI